MNGKKRALSTVLIADDEKPIREVLEYALSQKGYIVLGAKDGQEALSLASCADMMILDIMMPNVNGFEVIERLRKKGDYIPILVMSASSEKLAGVRKRGYDVVGAIEKPFNLGVVIQRVEECLKLNSSLEELQNTSEELVEGLKSMARVLKAEGFVEHTGKTGLYPVVRG